jgi:hypothetical protein
VTAKFVQLMGNKELYRGKASVSLFMSTVGSSHCPEESKMENYMLGEVSSYPRKQVWPWTWDMCSYMTSRIELLAWSCYMDWNHSFHFLVSCLALALYIFGILSNVAKFILIIFFCYCDDILYSKITLCVVIGIQYLTFLLGK